MKLHILSNPHLPTSDEHRENFMAYDCYKFIKHMRGKFKMIHYGIPGAKVDCEHIDLPSGDVSSWNKEAHEQIAKYKQPGDVILCFYGNENQPATIGHNDCKVIEPHIGYRTSAVFAPYRVFKSYGLMHYFYGERNMLMSPSWYDAVIPNGYTIDEFEFKQEKQDYMVFLGRVQDDKGVNIAIQTAEKAKKKLIIAGNPKSLHHLGYSYTPKHVEMVGFVSPEQRKELLANAMCLIAPTHYIEPFGNIVVEAHLSGTPTITSDWGGFVDTNIHGVTGYRCRLAEDFVRAVKKVGQLNNEFIRDYAVDRYSDEVVYEQMRKYILRVVRGDWYQEVEDYHSITNIEGVTVQFKDIDSLHAPPPTFGDTGLLIPVVEENKEVQGFLVEERTRDGVGEFHVHIADPALREQRFKEDVIEMSKYYQGTDLVIEKGSKFSVIIPTMWKAKDELTEMLHRYEECTLVGEVLVVDNSDAGVNETGGKDRIIYSGPNIYVTPAWNMGVKEAKYENIILANDDILINNLCETLSFISKNLREGMIMGVSTDSGSKLYSTPGHYIGRSWGEFMVMKKSSYVPIPENIKIWYGDNFLVDHLESHTLFGVDGVFGKSATINSEDVSRICEADRVAFYKTKYPRILHVVMSCNRPEYLRQAVDSWGKLTIPATTTTLLIDDMPNSRDDMGMDGEFRVAFDRIQLNPVNKGLSVVWKELWEKDLSMYDYILHQEDDVVVVEPVNVYDMIKILKEDPTLCAVTLMRQKWYDREEETTAKPSDEVKYGYRIEYRSEVFSPMFTLYSPDITKMPIAQHYGQENLNEGMIMRYLETMGFRVAYLKSSSGGPLIHHIGEYKTGKIVSEGEPGWDNFKQYLPNKKYCSKTGMEL